MGELWKAFVARLVYLLTPKPVVPTEMLKPGICECEHDRCVHKNGRGKCCGHWPPDKETNYWTDCSCQLFIPEKDDDAADSPETPSPSELEKLWQR